VFVLMGNHQIFVSKIWNPYFHIFLFLFHVKFILHVKFLLGVWLVH
jgi:hypothetical protein